MCKKLMHLTFFVLVMGLVLSSAVEAADPDLVGYWPFDTSTADDWSGNDNHGVVDGDPKWVPGKFFEALQFDGVDDYVQLTKQPPITNGFTFSAWVKRNGDSPSTQEVFNNHQFFLRTMPEGEGDGSNPFEAFVNLSDGSVEPRVQSNVSATLGQWFFVTVTWDKTTLEIYVDGELKGSSTRSGELTSTTVEARIGRGEQTNVNANPFNGVIDEVRIYNRVLTQEEIQQTMTTQATNQGALNPEPANKATDVPREVVLNWSPGESANTHDVYFGTSLEDVNNATATVDPAGVYQGRQDASSYAAGERFDFGQTYYWRVDEVNSAPDFTVFKGAVWSFTAEPLSIPITSITATASGSFGDSVPENTINGSGLVDDLHGRAAPDMWISAGVPATIDYAFDRVYKLHELWVWNSNQSIEAFIGFGAKDVVIEHSLDGENWTVLDGVGPLAPGPGTEGYAHNNTIAFNGATAQYVRITVNSVQGFAPQASLSEVRFFFIPTLATRPSPDSGASNVAPDLLLSWGRDGREAGRHDVYIGTDANDLSLAGSVTESNFDTQASDLQLGQTYHWQVVEVNDAMDPSQWAGAIWNFTTAGSIVVDGMESYKDEEFLEIWATWIDGFDDPANNGALVGANPSLGDFSPETGIVQGGRQSLPIHYDNGAAAQSEATRTFETSQDWTPHGVQSLVLYFQGTSSNTGGNFYIKINETKLAYDGDTASLMRGGWNKWVILLGDLAGVDLSNVRSLTLGVEGGGAGVVYVDDITLTPVGQRDLVTPTEPGGGLVLHLPFDGDYQDVSGNGRHGTPMGVLTPLFEAGHIGQAVNFDGISQYVEITGYQGILAVDAVQQPFSIVNWVKTTSDTGDTEMVTWGLQGAATRVTWRVHEGRLRTEHADGNLRGNTYVNDGEWHHVALTVMEGATLRPEMTQLYVDGREDTYFSGADVAYIIAAGSDVNVGRSGPQDGRYFLGSLDEVRIYDRHLSAAEVAWLAGRTAPFDR
ncbi:MAG: hypothetical protein IIC50_24370 [Planctomycetes bacterium]|nr:hypothetical protein [Planctomycetota bacterium]